MRKNKSLIIVALLLVITTITFGQTSFPESWEGKYKGKLKIFGVNEVKMNVDMSLDIIKKTDSVYQWQLIYSYQGKDDVRDYELKVVDKEKGKYIIDEKNSILIDGFYKTNTFTSLFKVSNSFIISAYTKEKDDLIFEIIAASENDVQKSGDETVDGNEIPEVSSYLVNGRQKALLKKY